MKKSLPLKSVALFIAGCFTFAALPAYGEGDDMQIRNGFPDVLDGTMMPYDFSATDSIVPWGIDMRPVFINYVARHGARFLSSQKKIDKLRKELIEARDENTLSEKGKDFLALIDRVDSVTDGRWGALNDVGIEEEKRLAGEMADVAPGLLEKGKIKAIATYVPRVVMTMYEFCHQLACTSSDFEISTAEGKQFNPLLRYFTTDSAYVAYLKNPTWKETYDKYAYKILPTAPAQSFFTIGKANHKLQKLSLDAYGILQSLKAAGIDADPSEWFTLSDYRNCWEVSNLEHYYERSANSFSMAPVEGAYPLLQSLINSTETALNGASEEVAFLRFGHAETLLPLFSLMRLPGCYQPEASAASLSKTWIDSYITPLGANLMIVVLKDQDGTPFVALRLNGKWVDTDGSKLTEWSKMKSLWESYMRD
ncbi:MAG: histidine phosphatase family protein [Muribaculaceae bacterium]|nr:histidine phosphatase family protein [Muribaculaceae bacterium]